VQCFTQYGGAWTQKLTICKDLLQVTRTKESKSSLLWQNNQKKTPPKWKDELSTTIESKFCRSRIDQGVFFDVEVDCIKVEIKVECVKPKSNLRSTT